jgi:hypothetical protein
VVLASLQAVLGTRLQLVRAGDDRCDARKAACRKPVEAEARLRQHRNIDVGGAMMECDLYGSGNPVLLLANAGCSTGYFDDLACKLATGGLQVCVPVDRDHRFRSNVITQSGDCDRPGVMV